MNDKSLYHVTCECGAELTSPDPKLVCPKCGRQIELVWPAPYEGTGL